MAGKQLHYLDGTPKCFQPDLSKMPDQKPTCQKYQYPIRGTNNAFTMTELSHKSMTRLLSLEEPRASGSVLHGAELLDAVRRLDAWTAEFLGCQTANLEKFRFKVVQASRSSNTSELRNMIMPLVQEEDSSNEDFNSYMAVSYCWHGPQWKPALGLQSSSQQSAIEFRAPLMPAMLAAVLNERSSETEPLWLDQWCINQHDEKDKKVAVSMMDLLYSSARKVVVCLEDVRLSPGNMETLLDFSHYLEEHAISSGNLDDMNNWDWNGKEGHLFEAVTKIFKARWFSRAWCAHEYWLGKSHVFLVAVTMDPSDAISDDGNAVILRFDPMFLGLTHFFSSSWIPGDQAESVNKKVRHFNEHTKHTHPYYWADDYDYANSETGSKVAFVHAQSNYKAFTHAPAHFGDAPPEKTTLIQQTFAVVDTLGAMNRVDKLTITLNVARTGLYLKKTKDLTPDDIAWIAMITALASGDATVLASRGPPICPPEGCEAGKRPKEEEITWTRRPQIEKFGRLESRIFGKQIPLTISERGLEISVIHLGMSAQIVGPEALNRWLAEAALAWLYGKNQHPSKFIPGSLQYCHLLQALACLITGGPGWAIACAAQVRMHPLDPLRYLRLAQSETEIRGAFQALNMVMFRRDASFDLEGTKLLLDQKQSEQDILPSIKALVTVAEALVRTVMGEHTEYTQGTISETDELQVCVRNIETHGGIIIFAPPASKVEFHLVCPEALRTKEDSRKFGMARGWILEATSVAGREEEDIIEMGEYRLLGKTRLFMPLEGGTDPFGDYQAKKVVVK